MTEFVKKVVVLNPSAGGGGGGTVTANQGEPGPCSQEWPVALTGIGESGHECIYPGDTILQAIRVVIAGGGLPLPRSIVNYSGTITTGGTSQLAVPTNPGRTYLFIQNVSNGDLWFNFVVAAVMSQPSIRLSAGDSFVMECSVVSVDDIFIIGATTGQEFVIKESS